jgi:chromate transporter
MMFAFAILAPRLSGPIAAACLHGLKLMAVAVVAQAIWSMARSLCPDPTRAGIAMVAAAALLLVGWPGTQLLVLGAGAALGAIVCRHMPAKGRAPRLPVSGKLGACAFVAFLALLMIALLAVRARDHSVLALVAIFYRAGALVFGGGHVVLPLLRASLVPAGWLDDGAFLSGYGAAQAMPGPLFSLAAYVGAGVAPPRANMATIALWSAAAQCAIFLPGLLFAVAGLSVWASLGRHGMARGGLAGANAAVVGVLGAAFVTPVWTTAVLGPSDLAIAALALALLARFRAPPLLIVAMCMLAALGQVGINAGETGGP